MDSFACTIVGGGPAGACLAWLLAGSGHRVLLVDDGRFRAAARRETMLAAARPGLQGAGLWDLASAAARPDPCRHGAIWGSPELAWQIAGEPGLLLERGPFDERLRAAAVSRGAILWPRSRLEALPAAGCGEFVAIAEDGSRRRACSERFVVATGRRAARSLLPLSEVWSGPETAALTLGGVCTAARSEAVVEAVPQGWWWWVGDLDGTASATLLADADELATIGSRALVQAAIAASRGPVARLAGARPVHAVRATARRCKTTAPVLLLGDAAATIDPLSSQGVEKAMAAADHAAAVLRTARERPAAWPTLLDLHARWEHGLAAAHASTAATFLRQETRFVDQPFWRARLADVHTGAVMATPAGLLRISPQVAEAPVWERQGERFVEVAGVHHAGTGEQLAHVGHVPVVPLLRTFRAPRLLADGVAAAGADPRLFVLPVGAVHAAARVLASRGFLVSVGAAEASR